jgi:hypothetical protein
VFTVSESVGFSLAEGFATVNFRFDLLLVPEPSTLGLLAMGIVGLAGYGLRRRRKVG